jgi:hypothetical protein
MLEGTLPIIECMEYDEFTDRVELFVSGDNIAPIYGEIKYPPPPQQFIIIAFL